MRVAHFYTVTDLVHVYSRVYTNKAARNSVIKIKNRLKQFTAQRDIFVIYCVNKMTTIVTSPDSYGFDWLVARSSLDFDLMLEPTTSRLLDPDWPRLVQTKSRSDSGLAPVEFLAPACRNFIKDCRAEVTEAAAGHYSL